MSAGSPSRTAILLAGLAVGLTILVGATPSASAHSDLISSTPAADTRLPRSPAALVLTFGEDVDSRFTTITLAVDDADTATLQEQVDGATVTAKPPAGAAAGRWTVAYRIVSADGHPVTGRLTFTVAPPAASGSTPTASTQPTTPSADPTAPAADPTPTPLASPSSSAAVTDTHRDVAWWKWPIIALAALTLIGGPAAAAARGLGTRPTLRPEPPGGAETTRDPGDATITGRDDRPLDQDGPPSDQEGESDPANPAPDHHEPPER